MAGDLDRLKQLLNGIGADDGMISRGVSLTQRGYDKLAGSFGVSVEEIKNMITQLSSMLSPDEDTVHIAEAPNRYSYETDFLNNVTLRDRKTGEIRNLVGHEAFSVLAEIERLGDYQALVAAYFQNKTLHEFMDVTGKYNDQVKSQFPELMTQNGDEELHDFDDEIKGTSGTFNFPFRQYGATARFWGEDGDVKTKVISIRNNQTHGEVKLDSETMAAAEKVAQEWRFKV